MNGLKSLLLVLIATFVCACGQQADRNPTLLSLGEPCPIPMEFVKTDLLLNDGVFPIYESENGSYFVTAIPCIESRGYHEIIIHNRPDVFDVELNEENSILTMTFQMNNLNVLEIDPDEIEFVFGTNQFNFEIPIIQNVVLREIEPENQFTSLSKFQTFTQQWEATNLNYTIDFSEDSDWFLSRLNDDKLSVVIFYFIREQFYVLERNL